MDELNELVTTENEEVKDDLKIIDLPPEDPETSGNGALIGLAIGAVTAIFGGALLYRRHKKKKEHSKVGEESDDSDEDEDEESDDSDEDADSETEKSEEPKKKK